MTSAQATGSVFFTAFRSLTPDQRAEFLRLVQQDEEMREDVLDSLAFFAADAEPGRPLEEILKEQGFEID